MKRVAAILLALCVAFPVLAVEPDEILDDPALEARARALSEDLRCLVCRNENIDESNAELARDLRILVRERLVLGDTDDEVIEFVVARYGEYVLLNPRATGSSLILWLSGPLMLLLGGGVAIWTLRRRPSEQAEFALSEDEQARLDDLLSK